MRKSLFFSFFLLFTLNAMAQLDKQNKNLLKKYNKAITEYNKANDSTTSEFYYKRGGVRQDHLDYQGAVIDYDKSLTLDPDNYKIYYNRGLAKMDLQLLHGAIADFSKSISLNPDNPYAYNNRAICKYDLKDHFGATQDSSMAITLDPKNAAAYNNRGINYIKMGLLDEGCKDLHKAYELGDKKSIKAIKKFCK